MSSETVRDLLQKIVESLVDSPDQIDIKELHSDQAFIFELKVDRSDVGKVIGRGGKTAMAMRTILEAASGKYKRRVILEILE